MRPDSLTDILQFLGVQQQHVNELRNADAVGDVFLLRLGLAGQRPQ